MAGNITIPKDLTKVIEIKQTDKVLLTFLTELTNKVNQLEETVDKLQAQVDNL